MNFPVNPHRPDFGFRIEVAAPLNDHQIGYLARLDAAQLFFDAAQPGGNNGQPGQRILFR